MKILQHKMANIDATGAGTVVTACPGCQLQLRLGVQKFGLDVKVMHLAELLDQAYKAGK